MLPPVADWRDAAQYSVLERAGRPGFAWEWLRRMHAYRTACLAACGETGGLHDAARFGLHRFEPAERGAPDARPMWRAGADPGVLCAYASPCAGGDADAFDVAALASLATFQRGEAGREHWLFGDGLRQIRLDIVTGTLAAGPVQLEYRLFGLSQALPQLTTLNRLIALVLTGRMSSPLFPLERRAKRWALVLRTWDALAAGTAQREIACELFGLGDLPRWRTTAPSWRRRVQRLAEAARYAAGTDPRMWLGGDYP